MICALSSCHAHFERPEMTAFEAHHEANRALHRAAELTEQEARQHPMVVFLRISLELRGRCPTCVLNAQADATGAVELSLSPEAARKFEQQWKALDAPRHVCTVIPFRRNSLPISRG